MPRGAHSCSLPPFRGILSQPLYQCGIVLQCATMCLRSPSEVQWKIMGLFGAVVLVRVGVLAATAAVIVLMLSFGMVGLLIAFVALGAAGFLTEWWARRTAIPVEIVTGSHADGETIAQAIGSAARSFAFDAMGLGACVLLFVALVYTTARIAAFLR